MTAPAATTGLRPAGLGSGEPAVPRAALHLGLAGLLPSVAMVAVMAALPEAAAAAAGAGIAYGGVIASFVGGTWWGIAAARAEGAARQRILVASAVPPLVAWPALLLPPATALLLLAVLFAMLPPTDARLLREGFAPAWWPPLRRMLSLGMAALHVAAAVLLMVREQMLPG